MQRDCLDVELAEGESLPVELRSLVASVAAVVTQTTALTGAVALRICDDDTMRDLNRRFRGRDAPTDVLAFATGLSPADPDGSNLGDVALSYAAAVRQSQAYGHSVEREFGYLLVHALLHIAGMSHDAPAERARMRRTEELVLAKLGLARAQPARPA